jgi:hypothetical protein
MWINSLDREAVIFLISDGDRSRQPAIADRRSPGPCRGFFAIPPFKFDPNQRLRTSNGGKLNLEPDFVRLHRRGSSMPVSTYLVSPARTLREACHEIGRDAGGKNCRDCPVADLCEKEASRTAERR